MASSLDPALASAFMCSFESKWLPDSPNHFKPVFYRRYVNKIFGLFSSSDHANKFREFLSSKHPNINFSINKDEYYCLSFLGSDIFYQNERFVTSVYRKRIVIGVCQPQTFCT